MTEIPFGERAPRYANNQAAVAAMLAEQHRRAAAAGGKEVFSAPPPGCPMHQGGGSPAGGAADGAAGGSSVLSKLNPLNYMPELSQERAPEQKTALSRERTVSSIPRAPSSPAAGDSPYGCPQTTDAAAKCPVPHDARGGSMAPDAGQPARCPVDHGQGGSGEEPGRWEYPSPQQFYNALVRKGWETPEDSVETMVLIHNFLNERAWQEIVDWEKLAGSDVDQLQLARFQGRPDTLSPRARMFGVLGWLAPSRFSAEPPFDRHDWIVRRGATEHNPQGEEVRYVIDYYSAPDTPGEDEANFNLDVRPAIDSFDAVRVRWLRTLEEWRAGTLFPKGE